MSGMLTHIDAGNGKTLCGKAINEVDFIESSRQPLKDLKLRAMWESGCRRCVRSLEARIPDPSPQDQTELAPATSQQEAGGRPKPPVPLPSLDDRDLVARAVELIAALESDAEHMAGFRLGKRTEAALAALKDVANGKKDA